jgi:hypothetical protein
MEQSWNNAAIESLHFPASALNHCSIDLSFSFARGPSAAPNPYSLTFTLHTLPDAKIVTALARLGTTRETD